MIVDAMGIDKSNEKVRRNEKKAKSENLRECPCLLG
jgi:hypothetical protein